MPAADPLDVLPGRDQILGNFSLGKLPDESFMRCWRNQDCNGCMRLSGCSWCPFTWSCVPNNYSIPALAPAWEENICPHWAERWEIRTRPLGCQVSTITSLTCIISVLSTILVLLLFWLILLAFRKVAELTKRSPNWWKVWEYPMPAIFGRPWRLFEAKGQAIDERDPLLPSSRQDAESNSPSP